MRRRLWPAVTLAVLLAAPGAARGASSSPCDAPGDDDESRRQRSVEAFDASVRFYRQGEFQRAIELLTEAYSCNPEPVLLYNFGRAYEGLGDFRRARDAYKRYLEARPDANDAPALQKRISTLDAQIAEQEELERRRRAPKPKPKTVRVVTPARESNSKLLPWAATGLGVVTLGVGAGLRISAQSKFNAAKDDPVHRSSRDKFQSAEDLATAANVLFVAGAVITAGGVTWLLLSPTKKETARRGTRRGFSVVAGPRAVWAGGRF